MNANATRTLVAAAMGCGLVLALPAAAALSWGVDSAGIADMKAAGATPAYGQIWVGEWMQSSGWGWFESQMRSMRDQGITPLVMWYYWGDSISVNAVNYGTGSKNKGEWDAMARDLANRGNAIMGGKTWLVVLEPEFNKQGVQHWETFDGYLADQARAIKARAPTAKIVTGFGYWGGWDIFDRAMAESTYSGFQILRGSTRDSAATAEASADLMISVAKTLKSKFGKNVIVFDLGIATYGGWEGVQERALQNVAAKRSSLESASVQLIVWRYVRDNCYSSGYFGPAECYWGVKTASGGNKRGFDDLVSLVKGQTAPAPAPAPTPPPPSGSAPSSAFTNVKGNEWWIQAKVAGSPTWVGARVNGGPWVAMPKQWWGDHAVSTHAPTGSTVELSAKYADGSTASGSYRWPDATPVSGGGTPPPSTGGFTATFSNAKGNDWWVQVKVDGNQPVAGVSARVNGGSWVALEKQWWGDWAKSFRAPYGSTIEFEARSSSGETARSAPMTWNG